MIAFNDGVGLGTSRLSDGRSTPADMAPLVALIRASFHEFPCLSLTLRQAMRLWCLDEGACRMCLDLLRREEFLRLTADGMYRRESAQVSIVGRVRPNFSIR